MHLFSGMRHVGLLSSFCRRVILLDLKAFHPLFGQVKLAADRCLLLRVVWLLIDILRWSYHLSWLYNLLVHIRCRQILAF